MSITDKRKEKFLKVASQRQLDLTVVLENVHDPHNIGAVLRTCDSVGISEIYVLNTDERLKNQNSFFGKASASGARKWVKIHYFEDAGDCFKTVKSGYDNVYGTHLGEQSKSLYDLNLIQSVALVFGNEHDGLSKETLKYLDGNFIIPQFGMVQSLNISVACAVSIYEACRQRLKKGMYEGNDQASVDELYKIYLKKDGRL